MIVWFPPFWLVQNKTSMSLVTIRNFYIFCYCWNPEWDIIFLYLLSTCQYVFISLCFALSLSVSLSASVCLSVHLALLISVGSFGVVKFWGCWVLGLSSFVVVEFWVCQVLGLLSFGVVKFWSCHALFLIQYWILGFPKFLFFEVIISKDHNRLTNGPIWFSKASEGVTKS